MRLDEMSDLDNPWHCNNTNDMIDCLLLMNMSQKAI